MRYSDDIPGRVAVVIISLILILSGASAAPAGGELVAGGATTVADAGDAESVAMDDATIDDSTASNVTVAYNTTSYGDAMIVLTGPNGFSDSVHSTDSGFYFNESLDSPSGVLNVTIPADTFGGGNFSLDVELLDKTTSESLAADSANLSVESNVSLAGYTLDYSAPVYPGENVTVNATLANSGSTTENFTVAAYSGGRLEESKQFEVPAEGTHGEVNVSFSYPGTFPITVNDDGTTKSVTVEDPVSVTGHHLSKTVANKSEDVTVNVTLTNNAGSAHSKTVWLWTDGSDQTKPVTVPGSSTKNASFVVNYTDSGEHTIFMAGNGEASVFVLDDTTGAANVSVARTFLPDTAVEQTDSSFMAVVENDGDASAVQNVTLAVDGTVVDHDEVYVDPGSGGEAFLQHNFSSTGEYEVTIDGGTTTTQNVTVRGEVVKSVSIERASGPGDTDPSISAQYQGGFIDFQITDGDPGGYNLSSSPINATTDTVYEVNLTVHNYTPRVLASSGRVVDWSASNGSSPDETNVTIRVKPTQMDFKTQFQGGYPSTPAEWDNKVQNDKADFGYDAAILLGIGNPRGDFVEANPTDLTNMTISTDAQLFDMPTYYPAAGGNQPRLEVPLAAPHETTNGNENDGFYRAFLPDALLDAWGVSDPESELNAAYSASDANLQVSQVTNGVWVNLTSFHYSSGTVRIERGSSGGGSSSSSGSNSYSGGGDETTTTTTTSTPIETATAAPMTAMTTDSTPPSTSTNSPGASPTPASVATGASTETSSSGQPGFGMLVAIVVLLVTALLARNRK